MRWVWFRWFECHENIVFIRSGLRLGNIREQRVLILIEGGVTVGRVTGLKLKVKIQ